jgi:hypothetical protein
MLAWTMFIIAIVHAIGRDWLEAGILAAAGVFCTVGALVVKQQKK